jgi:hypothetical protein
MRRALSHLNHWTGPVGILALLAALVAAPRLARPFDVELPLTMTSLALDRDAVGGAETGTVTITIERWSTPEERETFRDTLIESGSDALLDWLQDVEPRAGFLRYEQSVGWDIHFAAYEERPSGGIRVVFVTDRPMAFWEVASQTRSSDYEFYFCEIRLNDEGEGQGKLSSATRIRYLDATNQIEMEDYSTEPVRLQGVQVMD